MRRALDLYANLRPCVAYHPYVKTRHPLMDLVVIRENEEDTYAGIEHRQTQEVTQVLKLITRPGSERIVRYAFEYVRTRGRKRLTCMTKDNIMKLTDGLFHEVFSEIAVEYPEIVSEVQIIDIGAARLAANRAARAVSIRLRSAQQLAASILIRGGDSQTCGSSVTPLWRS